jgi:hypothetical protein
LKPLNPSIVNGRGERNSAAHSACNGRPTEVRCASIASKPRATGSGRAKRARTTAKPGIAITPCE